ncbi:glycosyltransferase family 2 protein [Microbacterium wangchenii]|uniref:glycosyltransferase family 2 protein n=1 Tax=Microbacterium wangchenii TaxID=2541726 RepID=UPI0011C75D68|nr:glycosyltransferase family 2 protein [Microbacterium wangchenii]TXK16044.1 glycosyltransferase family 2 protein [Microbacterium wangchenii]
MTEPMGLDSLAIIIVTYNSSHVIRDALHALPPDARLVIVDNASSDDTLDVVRASRPSADLIERASNDGFAVAVNAGIASADAEYVLLLNPDAVIENDSISGAVDALKLNRNIGILSPQVLEGDGTLSTAAGGFPPTIWRMLTHATGLSRLARWLPLLRGHYLLRNAMPKDGLLDVDWVSGGCMFIRRSVWSELSGLSERWFMYAEDVEFCLRAREAGWRVVMAPGLMAHHAVGESSAGELQIKTVWLENLFDLYRSHYAAGWARSALWRLIVGGGFATRAIVTALRPAASRDARVHDRMRFTAYARAALSAGH